MSRGRKPKDPKVIELQGPVSHRPEGPPAPPVAPGGLMPNPEFDGDALLAWNFWTHQMTAAGMSYGIDSLTLQAACFAYARAMRAERRLKVDPMDWRADIAAARGWKQVKDFAVEFGLTLVSRNRVATANPQLKLDLEMDAILNAS